jgi:predicted dehydrogenase
MAIDALSAGAHVIVEKPMATSLADACAMLAAARSANRMLAVYHNRRFDPWLVAAKQVVDSGRLGKLVEVSGSWPDNAPADSWRRRKLESGGLFFDLGAHLVDYLTVLAGATPARVSGHVHRRARGDPGLNEDHVVASIQFTNGVRGRIAISALDHAPAHRFHLVGENGTLLDSWNWSGGTGQVQTRSTEGAIRTETYAYGHEDDSGGGRPIYGNIAAHLFEGAPLAVTPEQALTNVAVLLAAEASAERGGDWIDLERFVRDRWSVVMEPRT